MKGASRRTAGVHAGSSQAAGHRGPWQWALAFADAFLAASLVALVEVLTVAFRFRDRLVGGHEIVWAVRDLVPLAAAVAVATSGGGALLLIGVARSESRSGRACVAGVAALPAALGVWGVVAEGALSVRLGLSAAGAVCAGAVAFRLAPAVARVVGTWRGRLLGLAWPLAVALGAVAIEAVASMVLPAAVPLRAALALSATWTLALGALALRGWQRNEAPTAGRARVVVAALGLGASLLVAPVAARDLVARDNIKRVFHDAAPQVGQALVVAGELAPGRHARPPSPEPLAIEPGTLDVSGRDIVLVTVESLRADHVGAYGYARRTTPHLDALAAAGVIFERAYTPTPRTADALASLLTGRFMRPLLRQGLATSPATWPALLSRYGYRTASFYSPAIWEPARALLAPLVASGFGFADNDVRVLEAPARARAFARWLAALPASSRLFAWIHLDEPGEPYERHAQHVFGDRALDRYDGEIAAADEAIGAIVAALRRDRPGAVLIVTADHGEAFGEHGERYHGDSLFEEQVRVPLVVSAPGLLPPTRSATPVSLVDLLPTFVGALGMPMSPRVVGRDLGSVLRGGPPDGRGAFAETEEQAMLAEGSLRLTCAARGTGRCLLFDLSTDPGQSTDRAAERVGVATAMRARLRGWLGSLARYEPAGSVIGENTGSYPAVLRRGMVGDAEAAPAITPLLEHGDVAVRRKAAEVLFELAADTTAGALRRALAHDDDSVVRRFAALGLTRLGQGAPLVYDLLTGGDLEWRRLAALALAQAGDARGEDALVAWWSRAYPGRPRGGALPEPPEPLAVERARQLVAAFSALRSRAAVLPLTRALGDARVAIHVSRALGEIGEPAARPALAKALAREAHHDTRLAMAQALVHLGGGPELRTPLVRFLGVPDPLPGGLGLAMEAGILELVGGPRKRVLERLRRFATTGVAIGLVLPKGGNGRGFRVLVRARTTDAQAGQIRVALARTGEGMLETRTSVPRALPSPDPALTALLEVPADAAAVRELHVELPPEAARRLVPGKLADFAIFATHNVVLEGCAVVPLGDELEGAR